VTGVVGALVALAVVVALVLVLAVRPHVRRLARSVAALRTDTAAGLGQLRTIRADRPHPFPGPQASAGAPSSIGGSGRHRRAETAP
jgi:hypothetical protein